jgi:hypothetical protein
MLGWLLLLIKAVRHQKTVWKVFKKLIFISQPKRFAYTFAPLKIPKIRN